MAPVDARARTYQTYEEPSLGDLFSRLSTDASTLVRQEVQLVRVEMMQKAREAGTYIALIAVGGVLANAALLALVATVILALAEIMDAWLAALIVGLALALLGGILIAVGMDRLRNIEPKPETTVATLRENKEWLAQQV